MPLPDVVTSVPFSWPGSPQDPVQVPPLEEASLASPAWVFALGSAGAGIGSVCALLSPGAWAQIPKHLDVGPKEMLPHVLRDMPKDA